MFVHRPQIYAAGAGASIIALRDGSVMRERLLARDDIRRSGTGASPRRK